MFKVIIYLYFFLCSVDNYIYVLVSPTNCAHNIFAQTISESSIPTRGEVYCIQRHLVLNVRENRTIKNELYRNRGKIGCNIQKGDKRSKYKPEDVKQKKNKKKPPKKPQKNQQLFTENKRHGMKPYSHNE